MIRPAFTNNPPVGRQGARKIPWWASTKVTVTETTDGTGSEFQFPAQTNNGIFVQNPFAWPIFITEARMWSRPKDLNAWSSVSWKQSMKKTAFRIKTSRGGYINSKWLPGSSFNTEDDRHIMGFMSGGVWTLPADFYLAHGSTPTVRFSLNSLRTVADPQVVSWYFQTAMRGYDPTNNKPIIVNGDLTTISRTAGTWTTYAYDSGRDQSVQDMWIRDFTFSLIGPYSAYTPNPWMDIMVQFDFPEGPHWTMDEQTPLIALMDQIPAFDFGLITAQNEYHIDAPVIHRPASPYVLLPGDHISIEAKLLDNSFWNLDRDPESSEVDDVELWVHFKGYQEGTHHAG